MEPVRYTIERLAKEYIEDKNVSRGIISKEWIDRITEELGLKELDDWNLSNMWDMVWLTLENLYTYYNEEDAKKAWKYMDAQSAFTEVVNAEARRRKCKNKR